MRIQIVGRGRMGWALTRALAAAGASVDAEPAGRGATGAGADVVVLAVPDAAIAAAARLVEPGRIVGHVSGATTLEPLHPHERFSLHPLITVAGGADDSRVFSGVHAAVAGTEGGGIETARSLARALGMETFTVADEDRAAYHAAASTASNFLVTVEGVAEELAATAGVPRAALIPLVRRAVENWAEQGAEAALTGPVVRGDEDTVNRQREAVSARLPEQVPLFDALVEATRVLARRARSEGDDA